MNSKADALILDDFGSRGYTHAEATSLLDLLEERYHQGVVMVTSQTNGVRLDLLTYTGFINDSTTEGSAKVDVSPISSGFPSAIFLKIRLMIFPDRVLGRASAN